MSRKPLNNRSSRPETFCKKGALKNFEKLSGKDLCQSPFFGKVPGLRTATLLKRDSSTRVFSCEICEICFTEHLQWN